MAIGHEKKLDIQLLFFLPARHIFMSWLSPSFPGHDVEIIQLHEALL